MKSYYQNDPRKMLARFASTCPTCGKRIAKASPIVYFPKGKQAFCEPCGEPEYLRFLSAVGDEDGCPFAS